MARVRLDQLLVDRGLASSRAAAQAMILAGEVELEGGGRRLKPGNPVDADVALSVREAPRWASRAGDKLEAAIDAFAVHPEGRTALDAGASTGGFTDVLLSHGAKRVYAIDVGRAQLIDRLRRDERVASMERTNLRTLESLPEPIDLATLDLSFISLRLVLPVVRRLLQQEGVLIALVKPQFEAGKEAVPRGGIVRDPETHAAVLRQFAAEAADNGFRVHGLMRSPITGADGNVEFLAHLAEPPGMTPEALEALIERLAMPSA
ncbi:MAG TPA: TlyA family RNA methyltransferase [Candidatus Limnocylindria bacterium]